MPVDNLFTTPIFARYIRKNIKSKNLICVSQMLVQLKEQEVWQQK